jgi:pimeloyl-ACP methyl ester carboxylesterase
MRLHSSRPGELNWLLLPGGPGIGSESLHELANAMDVSGSIWLIDLPGDGSHTGHQLDDPFQRWPQVLIEAAQAVPNAVFAGHSTGGMYLLATPAIREHIRGLALLDTAPDCAWHAAYVQMTKDDPLPGFADALAAYERDNSLANLTTLVIESAEWNFEPAGLDAGREMLARMPYNSAAVEWSDVNFDHTYKAAWWPTDIPVMRLWGARDRIVSQSGWDAPEYRTPNALACEIPGAGHFPWIEKPDAVSVAFRRFEARLLAQKAPSV